jgi:hypothetical protein
VINVMLKVRKCWKNEIIEFFGLCQNRLTNRPIVQLEEKKTQTHNIYIYIYIYMGCPFFNVFLSK